MLVKLELIYRLPNVLATRRVAPLHIFSVMCAVFGTESDRLVQ